MQAHALQLHGLFVQEEPAVRIEPDRAKADRRPPLIDHHAALPNARDDHVQHRRLDRPQPRGRYGQRHRCHGLLQRRHSSRRLHRGKLYAVWIQQAGLDRHGRCVTRDAGQRHGDRDAPPTGGITPGIAMHPVGDDRDRRPADQPDMAIDAGALIPPALHRGRIDPHRDHVHIVAKARKRRQVDRYAVIRRPVMRDDAAIHPDRRIARNPVKLQRDRLAAVHRVEPERPPVPADAALAITLRDVRALLERLRRRPVMRQPDRRPVRIVERHRRGPQRIARLDA